MKVFDETSLKKIDELEHMKNDPAASLVSALDDNFGNPVSVRHFSRTNYKSVVIFFPIDQITEVSYPLREVQDEHERKFCVSIQRNGFE